MSKFILLVLILNSCATSFQPAKFKYEGSDSIKQCNTEKYGDRYCEKDGKTLANGIQRISNPEYDANYYWVYSEGNLIFREDYQTIDDGVNIQDVIVTDATSYTTTFKGLGMITCKNNTKFPNTINENYITGKELSDFIKKTNGTFTCEDVVKEIEFLKISGKNIK